VDAHTNRARLRAYVVTFGDLAAAIGMTSAITAMLPGSGG
jgi:hypothetical protein